MHNFSRITLHEFLEDSLVLYIYMCYHLHLGTVIIKTGNREQCQNVQRPIFHAEETISELHSLACSRRQNVRALANNPRNAHSHPRCFLYVKNEKNDMWPIQEGGDSRESVFSLRNMSQLYDYLLSCSFSPDMTIRRSNWVFCQDSKIFYLTASLVFQCVSLLRIRD